MTTASARQSSTAARRHGRLRRWAVRVLKIAALVYLGLILVFYFLQTKVIFPGAASQGQREAMVRPQPGSQLVTLTDRNGVKIVAIFGAALTPDSHPDPDAAHRPTIIYFYGNGACMSYSLGEFDEFRRLRINVIVPDFEGYGMSGGKPSEDGCYAAADAVYDYLLTRNDVDHSKFVAVGWSLGAGAAIDLASRRPVMGLATFSAFTSVKNMGHVLLPWLPTSLIVRHHFDNLSKLPGITCPIFLAHGTADDLVPVWMCDRLAAAAKTPVTIVKVDGAGHNDILDTGGKDLMGKLKIFIDGI
jgi:pimeloyl-ACP methyl ester carboxylesterase